MAVAFNSDFYVTAATVIPVLYLALAVQGSTLDAALTWLYRVAITPALGLGYSRPAKARGMRVAGAFIILLAFVLSLTVSVIGEIIAIRALYYRKSSHWQDLWVLISVLLLAAVIALVASRRWAATVFRVLAIRRRDRKDKKRAIEIAVTHPLEGEPLIPADYRNMFVRDTRRHKDEIDAFRDSLPQLAPGDRPRLGSPTQDQIRKGLEEAFPPE
jgi:hypothetical protein